VVDLCVLLLAGCPRSPGLERSRKTDVIVGEIRLVNHLDGCM
jgi:hypothetical protein